MAANPIPDRISLRHAVLIVNGAAKAIEFYKRAFGAPNPPGWTDPAAG